MMLRKTLAALALYRAHRLSHGVDWPDCQIAATALRAAGVTILGKVAMHEGALGTTCDVPRRCHNPLRPGLARTSSTTEVRTTSSPLR